MDEPPRRPNLSDFYGDDEEFTRLHGGLLAGCGVLVLAGIAAMVYLVGVFPVYVLIFAPVLVAVGLAALIDPRVMHLFFHRKRVPWWVTLLTAAAALCGLGVGILWSFFYRGLV